MGPMKCSFQMKCTKISKTATSLTLSNVVKTYLPQKRPTSNMHPWPNPCISLTQILSFLLGLFGWMKNFPFQFLCFMSSFFTRLLVRLWFLVTNSTYLLLHKQVTLNLSDLNDYFVYYFLSQFWKLTVSTWMVCDWSLGRESLQTLSQSHIWWLMLLTVD